jgi:hypothetical protein
MLTTGSKLGFDNYSFPYLGMDSQHCNELYTHGINSTSSSMHVMTKVGCDLRMLLHLWLSIGDSMWQSGMCGEPAVLAFVREHQAQQLDFHHIARMLREGGWFSLASVLTAKPPKVPNCRLED